MFKMNYTNKFEPIKKKITKDVPILITFSTCWYIVKSKFPITTYLEWIKNLFSIVNNFNLVIYTDTDGYNSLKQLLLTNNFLKKKDQIKVIIKPMNTFYGYRYKDEWIKNHNNSQLSLHKKVDWELNMLWCEKIHFVNETLRNKYFDTMYHGWCDIGYFRELSYKKMELLIGWPSPLTLLTKLSNKIHYGCVQTDAMKYIMLQNDVVTHYSNNNNNNNTIKKSSPPISSENIEEICFSGGFFVLTQPLAEIYSRIFNSKLQYYFKNGFTVKDDQQIIMDCIFSNPQLFQIHFSENWFMFQELLL